MEKISPLERFLSLFTTVRPGEGRTAVKLCLMSFTIMLAYYLLKVIREPMILAEGSAELKAYATAAQAGLLMFVVPVFTRAYQRASLRHEKHHLFAAHLLFFIPNLVIFALAYELGWSVGLLFYIWLGIFSVMILALFWAFAADLFNLKTGQRLFPLLAAALALGALLGAGLASPVDQLLGHGGVMLLAATLLLLPWWLCRHIESGVPDGSRSLMGSAPVDSPYPLREGFHIVWRNRYLALIALFVLLLNLINTNGEYILASFVTAEAEAVSDADKFITRFYSRYFFLTTTLGFLIQLFLVARIYDRIGITGAIFILPLVLVANYSLLWVLPLLAIARATMVVENSLSYSLQSTTRHALFLPVTREEKYVAKNTIDTFFFRVGDVLSGGFIYLLAALMGLGIVSFIKANVLFALLMLLVVWAISRRHRGVVRENLKNAPPVLNSPLQDLAIPAGEISWLQLRADTFIDPDAGDALRYEALGHAGARLPGWVRFDALNRKFQFNPPAASRGSVQIRVVARDYDGLHAEASFTVEYGE